MKRMPSATKLASHAPFFPSLFLSHTIVRAPRRSDAGPDEHHEAASAVGSAGWGETDAMDASGDLALTAAAGPASAGVLGSDEDSDGFDRSNAALAAERRRCADEDMHEAAWIKHRKHVFVLSNAGKPIYSRYGDESKLSNLFGVMQAMVSFVRDNGDALTHVHAGEHVFVFFQSGPLYYVCAASTGEPAAHLRQMLQFVHFVLVSVLTNKFVVDTLTSRPQFDLRRMLGGTEPLIDSIIDSMDSDLSFLLGSAQCLEMPATVRATVGSIMQSLRAEGLTFALLVAERQLVTLVRPKSRGLHPIDLLLILNFIRSSTTLRAEDAESWTPFCFPHLNDTGHLHVYGNFISKGLCLLLASVDANTFPEMRECKVRLVRELEATGTLAAMRTAQESAAYTVADTEVLGLQHFLYKSLATKQFTAPAWGPPYVNGKERKRLFRLYQDVIEKVHSVSRNVRIFYQVGQSETVLAWMTGAFELYIVFGPLIGKPQAIASCNKLLRWIKSKEEILFFLNAPVW